MGVHSGLVFLAIIGAAVSLPTRSGNCPNNYFGNVAHPDRCDSFIFCMDGMEIHLFCITGFYYDAEAASCKPDPAGDCKPSYAQRSAVAVSNTPLTSNICDNAHFGMVANPDRCDAFYFCVQGTAIALECAPGTAFDDDMKVCRHGTDCAAQ